MRAFLLIAAVLTALLPARAAATDTVAPLRPVISAYTLGIGSWHARDTYLTPMPYTGWSAALGYERLQAMKFSPRHWIMQLAGEVSLSSGENPSRSATMWAIDFSPRWSMLRRFALPQGFTVAAGGTVRADIGALYISRNGNNPISARAAFTIGATAMAVWNGKIGHLPVTLRYQPTMPLTGVFFSPDYDELYYEIWLGNHSGLCHAAWPGNYFRLDNYLTADLHLGNTSLRLGYRCDILSTKVSGIVTRNITHRFVIGVTTEWISLRAGRRHTPDAETISALY